jgi:uncharacterized protein
LSFTKDKGRLLENLVYLNFRKKNKKLYYFKEKKECDFVVFEGTVCRWLIQVTHELHPDNRDREVEGLVEAMEFFNMDEGYIITMNQSDQLTKENKKIIIQDFKKFFDLLN